VGLFDLARSLIAAFSLSWLSLAGAWRNANSLRDAGPNVLAMHILDSKLLLLNTL